MPDPYWENLKQIFHGALACAPSERPAYLEQATNGDVSLRQTIESLLRSHEQADNFVDSPAYFATAEMLADAREFKQGQVVGHYEIISLLGEGGMGSVYLAEDTKLHRKVCLKFLLPGFVKDREGLNRFEQEARAASALNHLSILTIHEISEADGHKFIATEYIEGQTLRERLSSALEVDNALEIARQVASALVAAHRVGIVHRDIKPENIMIRHDDGLVKVLDFGLAKIATPHVVIDPALEKPSPTTTAPGVIIGTAAYMSPEQARGDAVDERTDVWSLGVVLYEMIAGVSPFIAATSNEILAAILAKASPPPMGHYAPNVPERLEQIVAKALNKKSDERYQTSQEFLDELKSWPQHASTKPGDVNGHKRRAMAVVATILLTLAVGVFVYTWRAKHTATAAVVAAPQIKSLAVLPLKPLNADENYLGVGIADAVIRKISQTGQLTVRPTSAVLKYVKQDTDSLVAARQLSTDAVLEGTVQRAGERLRVTVNLLRTSDGASLYTDNFDLSTADVFAIQDKVAQQIAARLQVNFDAANRGDLKEKYPTNPKAYEAYIRGTAGLDERGYGEASLPQMQTTIDFLNKAIEIDSRYAPAHAQLAFAYAWTALFVQPAEKKWVELARAEIRQATELDPNLAETHFAHALLLWSWYEGYQNAAAIRELRLAKELNPNISSPDLAALYGHVGLDDLAERELKRALEINPTSPSLKDLTTILAYLRADADAYLAAKQKLGEDTDVYYLLRKGKLDEAQRLVDQHSQQPYQEYNRQLFETVLMALKGKLREAEARMPGILAPIELTNQNRHHATYHAACVYALAGNSAEAVKWLKETAATGFPNYPLFERDPFLNRIRQSPAFIQFMAEQKAQWEQYRAEFSDGSQ
jgi:eukaryotic-like serine/threonine-protein kinase